MHGWSNEREQENVYHACNICDFSLTREVTVVTDRGFSSEKYNHHANLENAEGGGGANGIKPPGKFLR